MKKNKIIFLLFLLGLVLFSLSFYMLEPDYLWHLKAGEYMLHHGVLTKDVFSWYIYNKPWISQEWLFEVIIYGLKQIFGNWHVFLYCFVCLSSLMFTLYYANKKMVYHNVLFTILWFSFFIIMMFYVRGRPHMMSFVFLSLTTYFLYDLYKNEDSKKIYFLPLVAVLWSNAHGGSSNLSYLLCLLFMVVGSFQFKYSKIEAKRLTKKQYKKYALAMILCMVSVCINFNGFKIFLYPYQSMMDTTMLQNVVEWRNTSVSELSHYPYFILLILIVFIFLFSKKKVELLDFVLFGFCTYLGLKSIRFWPYTYIMMSYIVFHYVGKRETDKGTYLGMFILSLIFIASFFVKQQSIFHPSDQYALSSKDIAIIQKTKPARLFNMYDYGGDLIYHNIPVFVDSRVDPYSKINYKDYLNFSNMQGNYETIMEKYNFDYLLIDCKYPVYNYLKDNPDVELIYQNGDIYYYKKRTIE